MEKTLLKQGGDILRSPAFRFWLVASATGAAVLRYFSTHSITPQTGGWRPLKNSFDFKYNTWNTKPVQLTFPFESEEVIE